MNPLTTHRVATRYYDKAPACLSKRGQLVRGRGNYMRAIMASPKPEQDTSLAPSSNRAKS